jgi:hypothetical protein
LRNIGSRGRLFEPCRCTHAHEGEDPPKPASVTRPGDLASKGLELQAKPIGVVGSLVKL